jgi:aryl-alcohol dehydrogenase-like predicted oxidoreductase
MTNTPLSSNAPAGLVQIGDVRVNRLGFGAMRITGKGIWGPPADREASIAVLKRAVELGITFFDTADSYGPDVSESLIAEALKPYDGLVIATKGGFVRSGPDQWAPDGRPEHLREALEGSLRRLGVEQIQVYQFHTVDPHVPFVESLSTLIELKNQGKIKHIGLSNVTLDQLKTALNLTEIVSVQNQYNVTFRQDSEDLLQYCEKIGIPFIPYFPIGGNQGGVSGTVLETLAKKYHATPHQIALAWLLGHSPVMLPIPGTNSIEHLEENVAAARITLSDEEMAQFETPNP